MAESQKNDLSEYQRVIKDFIETLNLLSSRLLSSPGFKEGLEQYISGDLNRIENALASLLNWVRLQKSAYMSLMSIYDWSKSLYDEDLFSDVDEIRKRIRIMVLSASESLIQELNSSQKAAKTILPKLQHEIERIPSELRRAAEWNQKMLEIFGFDPNSGISDLSIMLHSLYEGSLERANQAKERILQRLSPISKTTQNENSLNSNISDKDE